MSRPDRLLLFCLGGLILSLLLVGVASATPLRHIVQAVPAIVALVVLWRGVAWGPSAASALFVFWLVIMSLIWLFLLGLASVVTGTFSPAERILTGSIGLSCVFGLVAAFRISAPARWKSRLFAFLAFALFAAMTMWASLQPIIARR